MTNRPQKIKLSGPANRLFLGMTETFYWFDDALKRFQQELAALPELTLVLSTQDIYPINISERLEKIKSEIRAFESDLRKSRNVSTVRRDHAFVRSTDLPPHEQSALQSINQHFVTVTDQIKKEATAIGKTLDARLADHSDVMWDYEMEATCHFALRDDDPGYAENSDNFLASRELFIHPCEDDEPEQSTFIGPDWPEGYVDDPMPHGRLFHELHHRKSVFNKGPQQNLKDIQRIGDVWIDLVVKFQFYYDLVQGKWVKEFRTCDEDDARVYATALLNKWTFARVRE
jgi:hypothetical protein